jgi:hypothetical protein
MMRIIPFDFEHVDIFEQSPEDIERYGLMTSESPMPMAEYGQAFTGIHDGRVLIMGGIMLTSERTAKCWTIVSKHAKNYGVLVFHQTRRLLENMMDDMKLHRLETANLKDAHEHHRWCRLLGFKAEGDMPMYDDQKRTWVRFGKVRG